MGNKQAIISALAYSDGFDFPLTYDELWKYLPPCTVKHTELKRLVQTSPHVISDGKYIALKNRKVLFKKRADQEKIVAIQRQKALRIAKLLSIIPWIHCICLSGSLAAGQAKKYDDIDFFIITKRNTLWISRIYVLLCLQILGMRRVYGKNSAPGKVCTNFFVDTEGLLMTVLGKDIYIAREIAQLVVLVNKSATFERFMSENTWIKEFLPNVLPAHAVKDIRERRNVVTEFLNKIAWDLQRKKMQKTKTTELVTEHIAAFHPYDYHHKTLAQFEARVRTIPH